MEQELGAGETERVREHLDQCVGCRQRFTELATLCAAARQMAEVEVPDSVWRRIREKAVRGAGYRPRWLRPRPMWLGLSGLVAAGLVVVLLVGGRRVDSTKAGTPAPVESVSETAGEQSLTAARGGPAEQQKARAPVPERVGAAGVAKRRSAGQRMTSQQSTDSVVVTSTGVEIVLKPGELLREYLGGMQRAAEDARAAMLENPGHPRVRQVLTSATVNRVQVINELSFGGE